MSETTPTTAEIRSRIGSGWSSPYRDALVRRFDQWLAETLGNEPATLSPQAVLDAILEHQYAVDEWHAVPVNNADEDVVWLTARKVDGHWQVKSVGSGE